jgi:Aldose 1-epimerase
MNDLAFSTSEPSRELQIIVLENHHLRIAVLPEAGARIWQITYKPLNVDLLWHNPDVPPACQPLHACYDDTWSGGWDDLFPNDEAADLQGMTLPDHGELWTGQWQATPVEEQGAVGVYLRTSTPISSFLAEKTLLLRPDSAVIEVRYRLTNQGIQSMPFLFKLHPAFAVSSSHRIDFPPMAVLLEPEFPGTLDGPPQFNWPQAGKNGAAVDLRRVPDVSSRAVHFFYGVDFVSGWCGITNQANGVAAALRFDPKVFSSCWLFASHGGWRDLNVAVLEPATGYPFRIKSMIDGGRARCLGPGESLETTVLFSVQEGLASIGGVEEDGRILPGDEN